MGGMVRRWIRCWGLGVLLVACALAGAPPGQAAATAESVEIMQKRADIKSRISEAINQKQSELAQQLIEEWREWDEGGELPKYQGIAYYLRSLDKKSSAQLERSLQLLTKWVYDYPDDIEARRFLAQAYTASGKPQKVLEQYRQIVLITPDDVPMLLRLSEIQGAVGNLSGALATLQRALDLNPNIIGGLGHVGSLQVRLGQHEAALESYHRQLGQTPDSVNYWTSYINVLGSLPGRGQERLMAMRQMMQIEDDQDYSDIYYQMLLQNKQHSAAVWFALTAPPGGIKNWGTAISPQVRNVLFSDDEHRAELIANWIEREPENAWALSLHGFYLLQRDQRDKARRSLEKARKANPKLLLPYLVLWEVEAENPDQQAGIARQVLEIEDGNGEWQFRLADALYRDQQYSDAIAAYSAALELFDLDQQGWERLVDALMVTGQRSRAVEIYLSLQKRLPVAAEKLFGKIAFQ